MKKLLIIDTETTGLDPEKNSVWQIGGYYRNENNELFSFNFKCRPLDIENITDEALKVCHITKEELMALPPAHQVYHEFRNFLIQISGCQKLTWVGYNCKFDQGMIQAFMKHFDPNDSIWNFFSHYSIDMYEWIKLLKTIGTIDSEHARIEIAYKLFGVSTDTAHDAVQDAWITYMLYQWAESIIKKGLNNDVFKIY